MSEHSTTVRDVAALRVARIGRVEKSSDPLRPFRLVDADGSEVAAVSEFLHHMLADDASPASLRSYAYELLAWVRFLHAVEVPWYLASRVEARDFALGHWQQWPAEQAAAVEEFLHAWWAHTLTDPDPAVPATRSSYCAPKHRAR
jgi:hypothetical protein